MGHFHFHGNNPKQCLASLSLLTILWNETNFQMTYVLKSLLCVKTVYDQTPVLYIFIQQFSEMATIDV